MDVSSAGGGCNWAAVVVEPIGNGIFAGTSSAVQVRLRDERPDGRIEVFADSDLELRQLPSGAACSLSGGIWARRSLFVSGDGRTVVVLESSGSNDSLAFVDVSTCTRVGAVDVSNSHWQLRGRHVQVELVAGPRQPMQVGLDADCRPQPSRR